MYLHTQNSLWVSPAAEKRESQSEKGIAYWVGTDKLSRCLFRSNEPCLCSLSVMKIATPEALPTNHLINTYYYPAYGLWVSPHVFLSVCPFILVLNPRCNGLVFPCFLLVRPFSVLNSKNVSKTALKDRTQACQWNIMKTLKLEKSKFSGQIVLKF